MTAFVRADYLFGVPEFIAQIAKDQSIGKDLLEEGNTLITSSGSLLPHHLVGAYLEKVSRECNKPDLVLSIARYRSSIHYARELRALARSCQNVGQALNEILANMRSRSVGIRYKYEASKGVAWISRMLPADEEGKYPQSSILWMACMHNMFLELTNGHWHFNRIWLSSRKIKGADIYSDFFQCPIDFNADYDAFFFPQSIGEVPISTHDQDTYNTLNNYLNRLELRTDLNFIENVRIAIQQNLAQGYCDIEAISTTLSIRPRTLQEQLKKRNTTFSETLSKTRFKLAENYLTSSDASMTEIAQRLCFEELSSFSNAFRRAYGMSPREWKKKHGLSE